jgi:hypothetical protein
MSLTLESMLCSVSLGMLTSQGSSSPDAPEVAASRRRHLVRVASRLYRWKCGGLGSAPIPTSPRTRPEIDTKSAFPFVSPYPRRPQGPPAFYGKGFGAGLPNAGAGSLSFWGFRGLWSVSLGSRPAFLPSRLYLRVSGLAVDRNLPVCEGFRCAQDVADPPSSQRFGLLPCVHTASVRSW